MPKKVIRSHFKQSILTPKFNIVYIQARYELMCCSFLLAIIESKLKLSKNFELFIYINI